MSPPSRDPAATTRYPFAIIRETMAARGERVLDFAIGRHRPAPPETLLELLRGQPQLALKRVTRDEVAELAERTAVMLDRQYGVGVEPERILPVPGGRGGISALVASVLAPGDGVLVTEPGYPVFARIAAQHHGHVVTTPLDPDRGFAPDLDALAHDGGSIRIAALNYPNNPTGGVLAGGTIAALGKLLPDQSILFNDATYGPLTYGGEPRSLLAHDLAGAVEQPAVELHSLSKLFGVPALPVSFLVGTEGLIRTIRDYVEYAVTPPSSLQVRATTLCVDDAAHVERVREEFGERVRQLRVTLVDLGFEPCPTPSGMYVLCRVPRTIAGRTVAGPGPAADALLETFDLAAMPWDTPSGGFLRFSALYRRADLTALAALGETGPIAS